ncbi:MAG TPA: hypothetical protein VHH36_02700 [Candidatus Thermoplasmatota archaeon]|nr:hypothetical protein [Candidatus Thermoplasmatota archaeon]
MPRAALLAALLVVGCLGPGAEPPRWVACPENAPKDGKLCLNWDAPVEGEAGGTRARLPCDPGTEDVPVQRLAGWPRPGASPVEAAREIAAVFGATLQPSAPSFASGGENLTWMLWRTTKGTVSYDDVGAGQPRYAWSGAAPEGADASDPQDVLRAILRGAGIEGVDARLVEYPHVRGPREAGVSVWWNGHPLRGLDADLSVPADGRGGIQLEFHGFYEVPDGALAFPAEEAKARAEAYAACLWRGRGEPASLHQGPTAAQAELAVANGTLAHRVAVEGRLRPGEACEGRLVTETVDVDALNGAIHGSFYEPERGSWSSFDCG